MTLFEMLSLWPKSQSWSKSFWSLHCNWLNFFLCSSTLMSACSIIHMELIFCIWIFFFFITRNSNSKRKKKVTNYYFTVCFCFVVNISYLWFWKLELNLIKWRTWNIGLLENPSNKWEFRHLALHLLSKLLIYIYLTSFPSR